MNKARMKRRSFIQASLAAACAADAALVLGAERHCSSLLKADAGDGRAPPRSSERFKGLAYLSAGGSELQVIDIADAAHPRQVASYGRREDKVGVWGLTISADRVYLAYITAVIPFQGTWSGIKAVQR